LGILNRLAGASDEMATMLKFLDKDQNEKVNLIESLTEKVQLQKEIDQKRMNGINTLKNNLNQLQLDASIEKELISFLQHLEEPDLKEISLKIEPPKSVWSKLKRRFVRIWKSIF
jgi:hypothetical protein